MSSVLLAIVELITQFSVAAAKSVIATTMLTHVIHTLASVMSACTTRLDQTVVNACLDSMAMHSWVFMMTANRAVALQVLA